MYNVVDLYTEYHDVTRTLICPCGTQGNIFLDGKIYYPVAKSALERLKLSLSQCPPRTILITRLKLSLFLTLPFCPLHPLTIAKLSLLGAHPITVLWTRLNILVANFTL